MTNSMHYPVESFVPQASRSATPAPQQQEARDRSVTPTPRRQEQAMSPNGLGTSAAQPSVIMPASNGSGRTFPPMAQRNGLRTTTHQQRQGNQPQRNDSSTPAPQQQQIHPQDGNSLPLGSISRESPFLMTIESQTYIRFDAAARLFAQQNGNGTHHPPQPDGYHGSWSPHVNLHNGSFLPQSNGNGAHGFMTGDHAFRSQTVPPPMVSPGILPARNRSDTIRSYEPEFQPLSPPFYYQPGNNHYYPDYRYPVPDPYYYATVQPHFPVHEFKPTAPSVPWFSPVYLRKAARFKSDDPEAKLFIGDLPVKMTTEALSDALKRRFTPFGECKVNVTWKSKPGPNGTLKSLPTGWIQYKTVFEAAKALDVAKEQGFTIGKRPIRIDRADGKRICRMWPTNPHATPSLDDFKNSIRQYVHHVSMESAYCMLYHVSGKVESVEKNYGGRIFDVPSVGVVFRWVEDASYAEQKFSDFTHKYRLKIEHVNSGIPVWREGPVSLRVLDGLMLDTGEKWQEELILSRRRLRNHGEEFPDGKMAKYPERISKKLIPRSILEHPRLKKDVFGFDPLDTLDWLDLHRERPTPLAMAINSKKLGLVNCQTNGH